MLRGAGGRGAGLVVLDFVLTEEGMGDVPV